MPGSVPFGTLVARPDGWLYGTTSATGAYGLGTVFRVSPTYGAQSLYAFGSTDDGGSVGGGQSALVSDNYRMVVGS